MGARLILLRPATTRTAPANGLSAVIAADSSVADFESGGHGSRALSRPMREDAPAARMMAQIPDGMAGGLNQLLFRVVAARSGRQRGVFFECAQAARVLEPAHVRQRAFSVAARS